MAPADRNPKRRASPMPASDSETARDDGFEPTTVAPMPRGSEEPRPQADERTRRVDVSENPGYAEGWYPEPKRPARSERGRDPRRTDVYRGSKSEKPDVVGAPERTVVAPLPRRHEEVEPIPDVASTSGARLAAEADARRQRRVEDEVRRRDDGTRRDGQRRDGSRDERPRERAEARETDREPSRRAAAKERTTPGTPAPSPSDRNAHGGREDARSRAAVRPEGTDHGLVHQPTSVDRLGDDSPWARLGVALRDVSAAVAASTRESWVVLRREGVKPFLLRMKPGALRVWQKTRDFAVRVRTVAVTKAVELGLVKPKRTGEYEQHGDGKLDHSRVEAWRRFHKGKTSSSYLQDDE